jgi:GT2 family glycosyltransferase
MSKLFINRLKTIVEPDQGYLKAASSVLFYLANRKRIQKGLSKMWLAIFKAAPVSYSLWIKKQAKQNQQTIVGLEIPFTIVKLGSNTSQPLFNYINYRVTNTPNNPIPRNEYVLCIDETDILDVFVCKKLSLFIAQQKKDTIITFDYDIHTQNGRTSPRFNPGWSPHLFVENPYLQNAICIPSAIWNELDFEKAHSATDIATLALNRFYRQKTKIVHLPEVLLSKASICSTALTIKPFASQSAGMVSVIIPAFNKAHLLKQCIDSIISLSTYKNYEIILVSNRSNEASFFDLVRQYETQTAFVFTCIKADIKFNFSALINIGAKASKGDYLLLLNNDTEIITADWIEQLLRLATLPYSGAVGAKLLYPNNSVQHAGIVLEQENISRHIYVGENGNSSGYLNALQTTQNYSAITAACLMIEKQKFDSINGFDELFEVEFNDIDFCLRLYQKGFYNVYCANAVLYHYESASRRHPHANKKSYALHLRESKMMREKWEQWIANDIFFNKNRLFFDL